MPGSLNAARLPRSAGRFLAGPTRRRTSKRNPGFVICLQRGMCTANFAQPRRSDASPRRAPAGTSQRHTFVAGMCLAAADNRRGNPRSMERGSEKATVWPIRQGMAHAAARCCATDRTDLVTRLWSALGDELNQSRGAIMSLDDAARVYVVEAAAQGPGPQATAVPLTAEERQILNLLLAGKANKQIAAQMDISVRTVQFRIASLLQKFKAESRTALIQGLLHAGRELPHERLERHGIAPPASSHIGEAESGNHSTAIRPAADRLSSS